MYKPHTAEFQALPSIKVHTTHPMPAFLPVYLSFVHPLLPQSDFQDLALKDTTGKGILGKMGRVGTRAESRQCEHQAANAREPGRKGVSGRKGGEDIRGNSEAVCTSV